MKRPFAVIGFTVFLTVAILFDKKTGVTAAAMAVLAVALVTALLIKPLREGRVVPLSMASGAVACAILIATNVLYVQPLASFANGIYPMKAQITSEVTPQYGKYYYTAKTVTINGEEFSEDIRLVFSVVPDVLPYDYVEGEFMFYRPGMSDPDYLNSNLTKGLVLGAYPIDEVVITETPEDEKPFGMKLIELRKSIRRAIYRVFPDENGSLAVAMILGDKSGLPQDICNDMRLAGVVHIVCVSGLHLSLWASLIIFILRKLKLPEKIINAVAALGVIGFMMLTGFTYSVMRSGIMTLAFLLAEFASRKSDSINSLGFSVLIITAFSPFACASVSLQLSVLSTLGILVYIEFIKPDVEKAFENKTPQKFYSLLHKLINALLLTFSATLMIQPVMIGMTGGFSFATVISNLIITPVAGPAMVVAALSAAIGLFVPAGFNIFCPFAKLLLQYIIRLLSFVAKADFFCTNIGESESDALIGLMLIFVGICLITALIYSPKPFVSYALVCLIFFSGILSSALLHKDETIIRVFDTGNGLSVLFEHKGEAVLVGCGGDYFMGAEKICDVLGNTVVDTFVIPSAHETSSSYLIDVLDRFRPSTVYADELPENAELLLRSSEVLPLENTYEREGFTVSFHELNGKCFAQIKNENITLLICSFPGERISLLPPGFREADVIVARSDYPCDVTENGIGTVIICADNQRGIIIQNELNSKGIFAAATGGNGDIVLTADGGGINVRRE